MTRDLFVWLSHAFCAVALALLLSGLAAAVESSQNASEFDALTPGGR